MSPDVTWTWAGRPSRTATSPGPWDSPAVSQRSMPASLSRMPCAAGHASRIGRSAAQGLDEVHVAVADRSDEDHRDPGADDQARAHGDVLVVEDPQPGQRQSPEARDEEPEPEPEHGVARPGPAERHA